MLKYCLKRGLLTICGLLFVFSAFAQNRSNEPPPTADELLKWHEVFTYEVRYSFFKLGEVDVEIVSDTLYNGKQSWVLRTIIRSNPGIPFVGREENHYQSVFYSEGNSFNVQEFWSDNVDENEYKISQYIFDRSRQKVYAYDKNHPRDTLALEEPASSGHITFLMSRLTAGTDTVVQVPVYLNREKKYLTATHTTKTEMREYEAFPGEIETYYTTGETNIDGPFGFSGEFEAWYRTDDLRVPVEARVKVWLGKAKIRLIEYKKELKKND